MLSLFLYKGVGDFPTDTQSAKKRSLTGSFGSRTPHPRSHESRSGPKTTPNHKQRHSAGSILETHGEQTVKKPARKLKSQGQVCSMCGVVYSVSLHIYYTVLYVHTHTHLCALVLLHIFIPTPWSPLSQGTLSIHLQAFI